LGEAKDLPEEVLDEIYDLDEDIGLGGGRFRGNGNWGQ